MNTLYIRYIIRHVIIYCPSLEYSEVCNILLFSQDSLAIAVGASVGGGLAAVAAVVVIIVCVRHFYCKQGITGTYLFVLPVKTMNYIIGRISLLSCSFLFLCNQYLGPK